MRFELDTVASPDQVRRAFIDFSDRRLRTWRRSLDPSGYELRGLGPDWAEARESSPRSPVWVVSRYDWSDPEVVRWVFTETSYGGAARASCEQHRAPAAEAGCTPSGPRRTSAGNARSSSSSTTRGCTG